MSFELIQRLDLSGAMELQQDRIGKIYEIIDYWQHQPKLEARLKIGGEDRKVDYVFAPPSFLNYINPGEKFGAYLGNMMMVNSELQREHPEWVPYVLLKLYAEKFAGSGHDLSGTAKHWQSLFGTIRTAGAVMNKPQLHTFLETLSRHETSGYFTLDREVQEFMEREGGNALKGKRRYLDNHRRDKWVTGGRNEEYLTSLGFRDQGFRNHAEAVMTAIDDLDTRNLYLAAAFMHELSAANPGTPVIISPPCNAFAYALTKKANGMTNLVEFIDDTPRKDHEDVIVRLPKKMSTWVAVSKRLSYLVHAAENSVRELIKKQKKGVGTLLIGASQTNQTGEVSVQITGNATSLEELSKMLTGEI